jgi:hypothetical protein
MAMSWTAVSSSNIAEVGFDSETGRMGVRFLNDTEYEYDDVPADAYEAVKDASSVGKTFNQLIKGVYTFRKIR